MVCYGAGAADLEIRTVGVGHDACGYRANRTGQFYGNARSRVDVLQVVDELGEVLNGIDIVVRRRRNQPHPGDGVAHARDGFVHLVTGKLTAFAGFRALRHFDL
jgi:hypothetical protein